MGSTKTIRRERQTFGPNETDKKLPYFVCWDIDSNPDVAEHQAQFSSEADAEAFFDLKCKESGIYVWRGVLGVATHGLVDWFHTHWSNPDVKDPEPGLGCPWSASELKFEKFEPYKPCCPTEES